ncbi:MAG: transporter substrate-binding domain-containing protein, partial [Thermoleophilia bacterium]|nr:transporter substrate-binding domain-containing protein [Thermoleophilia bacterium]
MRKLALLALFLVVLVAACGGGDGEEQGSPPPPAAGDATTGETAAHEVPTKQPGTLLVGAEFPSPPFLNPPRENPTGFEVDIANEVAKRLGGLEVRWLEIPWTSIFAPGPKRFDMD